jgi:hypothetical protein
MQSCTTCPEQNNITIDIINPFDYEHAQLVEFVLALENLDLDKLKELFVQQPEKIGVLTKWNWVKCFEEHFDMIRGDGSNKIKAFRDRCSCFTDKISVGFSSPKYPKVFGVVFDINESGFVTVLGWCNYMQLQHEKVNTSMPFFTDVAH